MISFIPKADYSFCFRDMSLKSQEATISRDSPWSREFWPPRESGFSWARIPLATVPVRRERWDVNLFADVSSTPTCLSSPWLLWRRETMRFPVSLTFLSQGNTDPSVPPGFARCLTWARRMMSVYMLSRRKLLLIFLVSNVIIKLCMIYFPYGLKGNFLNI